MRFKKLHDWNVSPSDAIATQNRLRSLVRLEPLRKRVRFIAGADISYDRFSLVAFAAFVVLDAKTLGVIAHASAISEMRFPYIPGLLSFREIPPLIEAWKKLRVEPDLVMADGQGIAHPRRLGIASHLGLLIDKPTIGCGKSRLCGAFEEPGPNPGDLSPLMDRGERIGVALRSKLKTNPLFVSPGHLTTMDDAIHWVLATLKGYRVPEPTRQAHLLVNLLRRQAGPGGEARRKSA